MSPRTPDTLSQVTIDSLQDATTSPGRSIKSKLDDEIFQQDTLKTATITHRPNKLLTPLILLLIIDSFIDRVHEVRFIASKSGRTDYALTNETIELSCHHLMKDHLEDVKQLVWSKDGQNILWWRKGEPGMKVLSHTFKRHIDNSSTSHHIIIHNVTIEMHGKYKCSIRTDLGMDENERQVIIISQPACRLGDWRIRAEPAKCRETLTLDCRHMFPKPAPSCGLWNGKLEKVIMGLSMDISEDQPISTTTTVESLAVGNVKQRQKTYRVRFVQQFDLQQQTERPIVMTQNSSSSPEMTIKEPISPAYLLQFAGHLWFKCDIFVPDTSWRLSLAHKMFDYSDACLQDPIETIAKWRLNYSHYVTNQVQQQAGHLFAKHQMDDFEILSSANLNELKYELLSSYSNRKSTPVELNCWQKPKLGTLAKLSCSGSKFHLQQAHNHNQVRLKGASLLQCGQFGWFPVEGSNKINKLNNSRPRARAEILKQRSGNRTSSSSMSNSIDNNGSTTHLMEEEKIPQKNGSTAATYIKAIDSNDLDDSNELVQQMTAGAKATTITNHDDRDHDDESLDIIPALDREPLADDSTGIGGHITRPDPLLSMQPSELAAVLPTCISPKARHQLAAVQRPLDRLALQDQDGRPKQTFQQSKGEPQGPDGQSSVLSLDFGSIFNFSSSSGCESAHGVATTTTMYCCLIVAALLFALASDPSV